jgi:hypothetical protein
MRKTLTAAQLQRLEQVNLQLQGPAAFRQPEIVARLALTDTQRQAIRQIEAETMAFQWEHRRPGPRPPPGGSLDRETAMRSAVEKIVALLAPEQRAEWQQLTGAPYRGTLEWPHRGPFHGLE